MRVIHLMGASTFTDPDSGMSYQAGPDGVFDLPEHVGTLYVTRHAGMFRRESDHEAMIAAAKTETLSDPRRHPATLQALLERVTAVEAKLAQWEEFFGTAPAAAPETPDTADKAAQPDGEAEAPGKSELPDDPETDVDADQEPPEDAPLRKPTPRKTAAKRHG